MADERIAKGKAGAASPGSARAEGEAAEGGSGTAEAMDEAALGALVRKARGGDAEAFAGLYGQYSRRVFGLCRHLLGTPEAAEDATSEVFLRAQRAMRSYDSALPFPRWLFSIAGHYCVDQLRRRRVERRLFDVSDTEAPDAAAPAPGALADFLASERRETVRTALTALPERYRLPLVLRYYSEMSYEQIAGTLGLNRNHVATLIFRGKKELRRLLAQPAEGPNP
jgi:RNA polymerase sigma-70 factor (ECF subfamily)